MRFICQKMHRTHGRDADSYQPPSHGLYCIFRWELRWNEWVHIFISNMQNGSATPTLQIGPQCHFHNTHTHTHTNCTHPQQQIIKWQHSKWLRFQYNIVPEGTAAALRHQTLITTVIKAYFHIDAWPDVAELYPCGFWKQKTSLLSSGFPPQSLKGLVLCISLDNESVIDFLSLGISMSSPQLLWGTETSIHNPQSII